MTVMSKLVAVVVFAVAGVNGLFAQAPTDPGCNALLAQGIKNEWSTVSDREWRNVVFHAYCRKSNNDWSFSHDGQVGLKQPYPIGIVGSWFTDQQQANQFCKQQASESEGRQVDASRYSMLSAEALSAWVQCQALSQKQVRIQPVNLDSPIIGFNISRSGQDPVFLERVTFRGMENCSIGDRRALGSGEALGGELVLSKLAVDNGSSNIRCSRALHRFQGTTSMPRAFVGIDTNRGSLDVNLSEDSYLPPVTTRNLEAQLASLRAELTEVKEKTWPVGPYCVIRVTKDCPEGFNNSRWADRGAKPSAYDYQGLDGPAVPYDPDGSIGNNFLHLCCKNQ